MPRTARVVLPNYPHHIIQRGHNRQTVFAAARDYERYLDNLREWKTAFGCRVYARKNSGQIYFPDSNAESAHR